MGPEVGIRIVMRMKTTSTNKSWTTSMRARMGAANSARKKREQACLEVTAALRQRGLTGSTFVPVLVTMTRVSAGVLDDDNLRDPLKPVRDGVADALGINDGDVARIRFKYEQRKGPPKLPSVEVLIERQHVVPEDHVRVKVEVPRDASDAEVAAKVVEALRARQR